MQIILLLSNRVCIENVINPEITFNVFFIKIEPRNARMIFNWLKITKNDKMVDFFDPLFKEFCQESPLDAPQSFLTQKVKKITKVEKAYYA